MSAGGRAAWAIGHGVKRANERRRDPELTSRERHGPQYRARQSPAEAFARRTSFRPHLLICESLAPAFVLKASQRWHDNIHEAHEDSKDEDD